MSGALYLHLFSKIKRTPPTPLSKKNSEQQRAIFKEKRSIYPILRLFVELSLCIIRFFAVILFFKKKGIEVKRIDIYLLKRFFVILTMTFFICVLILLMQFLWLHVKDLIGKGIAWSVLFEFFFYASLTVIPLALPLAVLLASLMTFGNLGESFELIAMKSAGISLFRIMRSIMIFVVVVCIGAFYFSNNILPVGQTKLWALIFSLRQKSPELDIPTGEFYSGIDNRNIYVRSKSGKMLNDLMIYDFSESFENTNVITADSGFVQLTADKKYLLLTLYNGESFKNLKERNSKNNNGEIPYGRESFKKKEMLIEFDTELNRFDESILRNQHVSKNAQALVHSIDSAHAVLDDRLKTYSYEIINKSHLDRGKKQADEEQNIHTPIDVHRIDSLIAHLEQTEREYIARAAVERANNKQEEIRYNIMMLNDTIVYIRRHSIELHRKFTLSFACLVFFFIGAPLGAIIRKGGLGVPVVISIAMFILYYIIDNTGYKMAREGIWPVFQGMWLSSAVLLPTGVFLTYKAVKDATLSTQAVKNLITILEKLAKGFS